MFTEAQANALILVEQLVLKNKDASLVKDDSEAIEKIRAVLRHSEKDKAAFLAERTRFEQNTNSEKNSNHLSHLQLALTNFRLTKIDYTNEAGEGNRRLIEPFALVSKTENWLLVAWCRLRKDFRYFRLDRLNRLEILSGHFTPHKMTLQEFIDEYY